MNNINADTVLRALQRHIGQERGISSRDLAISVTGYSGDREDRQLRKVIQQLRMDGHHICAHPDNGYYIAATPEELDHTCKFLLDRAMTTLRQVARMKKVAMPDLYGQLRIEV